VQRRTEAPEQSGEPFSAFQLVLVAEPGVDPVLALRAILKLTLRTYGLRCARVCWANGQRIEEIAGPQS
jgi:hypothetical protein